jgi:hypothetical protein
VGRQVLLLLGAALALSACPGPSVVCRVGAECASGVCLGDGTCGPVLDAGGDAGADGGAVDGGVDGGAIDSGADAGVDGGLADAGAPVGCQPNRDGVVQRSEVFFQAGLRATFLTSGAGTFETAGVAAVDGGRAWGFTAALPGDASRLVETKPLAGEWFETEFPDAGYVSELGQGSALVGVFSATADAVYLQGVVSRTSGLGSTRIRYSPWVKVLQFPLREGDAWSTTTSVSGRYLGVALGFQDETYEATVDRVGDAITPYATFPSLRVRTVMRRSINFVPTLTLRSFSWVTECFGVIATAQSQDNESSTEFTRVSEVRRLSP